MSFIAKLDAGRCRACGCLIYKGELIERLGRQDYQHVSCPLAVRSDRRPAGAPPIR